MTIKQLYTQASTAVGNVATINTLIFGDLSRANFNEVTYPVLLIMPPRAEIERLVSKNKTYTITMYMYTKDDQNNDTERVDDWKLLEDYFESFLDEFIDSDYLLASNKQYEYGHDVIGNNSLVAVKLTIDVRTLDC